MSAPAAARTRAAPAGRAAPASGAMPPRAPGYLFVAILVFLVLEYARPPGLVNLRLQFLITLLFPVAWFVSPGRPWSPVLTVQAAFLALCALQVPLSVNTFSAYMTTRAMYGNLAMSLGMFWVLADRDRFRKAIWVWLAVMCYAAFYAVTHGGRGPGGFLHDENDLALGCLTVVPFGFTGLVHAARFGKVVAASMTGLLLAAIMMSLSRGGFIGLVAVGGYFFATSRRKVRDLLLVLGVMAGGLLLAPQEYIDEITTIQQTDSGTAVARKFLWTTAFNMWLSNPVVGVGGGNFNYNAADYQPRSGDWPEHLLLRSWSGTTVHSFYFQMLSEMGAIGVGLMAAMLTLQFRILGRLKRDVRRVAAERPDLEHDVERYGSALAGATVAALAAGAFISISFYPYLWYFPALTAALDAAVRREMPWKAPGDGSSEAQRDQPDEGPGPAASQPPARPTRTRDAPPPGPGGRRPATASSARSSP